MLRAQPPMADPKPIAESSASPVRVDRVFDVLDAAAMAAEGRPVTETLPRLESDDFRAAAKLDPLGVRARLDRVVMGEDPERGLDELHEGGALAAIFPEVHAMVGFGDARVASQGRLEAHEAGRTPGRAAPRSAVGRPLSRHREGEDAVESRRTGKCTFSGTPRSGRACSTSSTGGSVSS